MNYSKRIKAQIDKRGWTPHHAAIEAGIGTSTVNNWFGRNSVPKITALESLCVAFGITLSEFFNEDGEVLYPTQEQKAYIEAWDCLHNNEKANILALMQTIVQNRKDNPY